MFSLTSRARIGPVVFVVLLLSSAPAAAQTTWSGGGADTNWSTVANWSSGIPADFSNVTFASASAPASTLSTTNDLSQLTLSKLSVDASAAGPVTIGGNSFAVLNGVDVATGQSLTITSGMGPTTNPSGGSFSLVKTGAGTLTLSGNPVTVTQGLQLNGGTLNLMTTLTNTNPNTPFAVGSGTTLTGSGIIAGTVTVQGTILAGSAAGASTLTIGGDFFNNGGMTIAAKLYGTGYTSSAVSDMGKINVTGANIVNLNGPSLSLDLSSLSSADVAQLRSDIITGGGSRSYTVFSAAGGITGAPTSVSVTNFGNFDPDEWQFTVTSDSNNISINFTPVPEPATTLAAGLGTLAVFGYRRRNRQLA